MDSLPPAPPPAIVQSDQQEAIDAVQRIVDMQTWLAAQQTAMPSVPDAPTREDGISFPAAVDAFWAATIEERPGEMASRRIALAHKYASAMADLATLRGLDGSLDSRARTLALAASGVRGPRPAELELREVVFGHTVYAGALIARDQREADLVLLFTPDSGWDVFRNLEGVHAELEKRARYLLTMRVDLPGLARKDIDDLDGIMLVGSRVMGESPFDTLTDRMLKVQKEKLHQAWFEFALDRTGVVRTHRLADRVTGALQLTEFLDTHAILFNRDALLHQAVDEARLARLPTGWNGLRKDVMGITAAWRAASDDYLATLRAVSARQSSAGIEPIPSLHDYAADMLRTALMSIGVNDDPENIQIIQNNSLDPAERLESLTSLIEGPPAHHIELLDLAYGNLPFVGDGYYSAIGKTGDSIGVLNDTMIRTLIRTLDLATSYPAFLESKWRTGEKAAIKRQTAIQLQLASMRFDAVQARLATATGETAAQKHPELSQRGWLWIQAVLDAPDPRMRRRVYQTGIAARQVTYKDVPISDIIEISAQSVPTSWPDHLLSPKIYYTPDAPDGITFREYESRNEADRLFFHNPEFSDYLLDRLPEEFAEGPTSTHKRRFKAYHRSRWIFGSILPDGYTPTEAYFISRDIDGNILEANYDAAVENILRNVRNSTRSPNEADKDWGFGAVYYRLMGNIAPNILLNIAVTPFRILPVTVPAYDNAKTGDYGQAYVDLTGGYVMALGAYPSGSLATRGTFSALKKAFLRAPGDKLMTGTLPRPALSAGSSRSLRAGPANLHGMYNIDGRSYLAIEGKLYPARYDPSIRAFIRSAEEPASDRLTKAAIRFHDARLRHTREVGVASPANSARDISSESPTHPGTDLYSEYTAGLETAFPDVFERQIVSLLMYHELVGLPASRTLTAAQRARVNQVWSAAEQALLSNDGEEPGFSSHFRKVPIDALPGGLWLLGDKPMHASAFIRTPAHLIADAENDWAGLIGTWYGHGVIGVQLTGNEPPAGKKIVDHTGRPREFAVELYIPDIVKPGGPVELLEIVGSEGRQYVLRTTPGRLIEMDAQQFSVIQPAAGEGPAVM